MTSEKEMLKALTESFFCGFGEPFERFDDCKAVAKWLKENYEGIKIRVNTNGQGSLIAKRNISPEMEGLFDVVSISLNADCAEKYQEVCRSRFGLLAYEGILDFAKETKKYVEKVIFSVVDKVTPKDEIENCRAIAKDCGVSFRVRDYIE